MMDGWIKTKEDAVKFSVEIFLWDVWSGMWSGSRASLRIGTSNPGKSSSGSLCKRCLECRSLKHLLGLFTESERRINVAPAVVRSLWRSVIGKTAFTTQPLFLPLSTLTKSGQGPKEWDGKWKWLKFISTAGLMESWGSPWVISSVSDKKSSTSVKKRTT